MSLTPSLMWPDDQAFCCATEIDLESTLVGLSEERAQQLLDDEDLEALPIGVEDKLDIDGDPGNRWTLTAIRAIQGLRRPFQSREGAGQS
jgi:hypothetical protein